MSNVGIVEEVQMEEEGESDSKVRETAHQFMQVMPVIWHGVGTAIRTASEQHGIVTMAQMRVMGLLAERQAHGKPTSLNDLSRGHEVTPAAMSRTVSTLVERGWVLRESDPADRRQIILQLTTVGQSIWAEVLSHSLDNLVETLTHLTDEELVGLRQSLTALQRVVADRRTHAGCNYDEKSNDAVTERAAALRRAKARAGLSES